MPENQSNPLSDRPIQGVEAARQSNEEHVWEAQAQGSLPEPALVRSRIPATRARFERPGMRTQMQGPARPSIRPPWLVMARPAAAGSTGRVWLVRLFNFITVASMALIFGAAIKLLWLWATGQWVVAP